MMLNQNEFTSRPEIILVTYDEVIKNPYPLLLQNIATNLKDVYKDFLHLDVLKEMDIHNLTRFCVQRTEKNILREIQKIDFDVDTSLKELLDYFPNIYRDSPPIAMAKCIEFILNQKFLEKFYIYTPEYDIRVHADIQLLFHNMKKVNYVTGPFTDVLDTIGDVTAYMLNDISYVSDIFYKRKGDFTNILVANYGYNYILDEEKDKLLYKVPIEPYEEEHTFKFAMFTPIELGEEHFSLLNISE